MKGWTEKNSTRGRRKANIWNFSERGAEREPFGIVYCLLEDNIKKEMSRDMSLRN